LEHSVVPVALFPGLQERAPLPNTLYVLFQQAYSCVVIRAEENIQATLLGKERGAKLGLDPQTPVIIGKRRAYDLLERRIELRTCVYITGDTTYSVNMD
jgi:GntR family transcriptional regulator